MHQSSIVSARTSSQRNLDVDLAVIHVFEKPPRISHGNPCFHEGAEIDGQMNSSALVLLEGIFFVPELDKGHVATTWWRHVRLQSLGDVCVRARTRLARGGASWH